MFVNNVSPQNSIKIGLQQWNNINKIFMPSIKCFWIFFKQLGKFNFFLLTLLRFFYQKEFLINEITAISIFCSIFLSDYCFCPIFISIKIA